ncbi:acetyl-CoA carboxylase carboxyltransferase subunit alpha [Eggerthia catenaformis]|uniref:acetyl-CoA carboxylase carboxyltransferase subunit alpha n=1 Tax=Eggerthia catenaformis TaxID=31973 RepID=UPI00248E8349|nr:acetyl-CoA carboxylase carboxyltransferase subunit alpha [Eggerthia catenaformis]
MNLKEKEIKIEELEKKLSIIKNDEAYKDHLDINRIEETINAYKKTAYQSLSAYDHVYLARKTERPHIHDYINNLFDDFFEMHGDRYFKDDQAIVGGIAYFHHIPVTIIGHQKARNLQDNMKCQFGMASPEGYRKAIRLMKQAEKFHRPVITFIDTPGAYPGIHAEENGIGEAIGQSLMMMSSLKVPIIVFVAGEGGSGGALALSIGNYIAMMENAVYSVLSPEGFSSILWKDVKGERIEEACEVMKLTASHLLEYSIIDEIIPEAPGGIQNNPAYSYRKIRNILFDQLERLTRLSENQLINERYKKYRKIGEIYE